MNYSDHHAAQLAAQIKMTELLGCGAWDPCADEPQYAAVCAECGGHLDAGDWQYTGRMGTRHLEYGCDKCCAIGESGELYDTRTGEVLAYAGEFAIRITSEEYAV